MLVHICCSVDSHFFLKKLKDDYPNEKLLGFFYDPNIHPYSEYRLRLLDVKRSCAMLNIELIEGEYNVEKWLNLVKGYEGEPEKGDRCTICYDDRLETSVIKAKELKHDKVTSTLLVSPKKSQEKLAKIGSTFKDKYGVEFIFKDYRSGGGSNEQSLLSKQDKLYRQDYCGCMFALKEQRDFQNTICDELFSPISKQTLPSSIEERMDIYAKRLQLEEKGDEYTIFKERFLNYRELSSLVKVDKKSIASKAIYYSTIKNKKSIGKVDICLKDVYYLNKNEIRLIDLAYFNKVANSSFLSVKELMYSNVDVNTELRVRESVTNSPYSLSAIFVLDEVAFKKYDIHLHSKVYEDIREKLVLL